LSASISNLPGIAPRLDDLERRVNDRYRRPRLFHRHLTRKRTTQPHAELGFKAGPDQLAGREHVAIWPRFQDATKARFVKAELLLDRLGGQADLPADLPLAGRAAPLDQRQLDAVGLVQTQSIKIGGRQVLAVASRRPEVLNRALHTDCHDRVPEMASLPPASRRIFFIRFHAVEACSLLPGLARRASYSTESYFVYILK
jgi:hypothetical protein